jgi:hypothetical protein
VTAEPVDESLLHDPGWKPLLRRPVWVIPQLVSRVGLDGLLQVRALFLSFCWALVLMGIVVPLVFAGSSPPPARVLGTVLVAGGAILSLGGPMIAERFRPLRCGSPRDVAAAWRTRFFLRLAFAESAALVGFVTVTLASEIFWYYAALPVTAIGFFRSAPTKRNLGRDHQHLRKIGCPVPLVSALRSNPPAR